MNRPAFFDLIRTGPFPGHLKQSQVDGIAAILDSFEKADVIDLRFQAYMLATVTHETAFTMQPIEEYGKGRGHAYGVPSGPWHKVYDGRGDVQLTWQANYAHASTSLKSHGFDVDLVLFPEKAMEPDIAAAIMIYGMTEGWFTRFKLADFFNDSVTDFVHARRIINGMDKAELIGGYGKQYWNDLKESSQ